MTGSFAAHERVIMSEETTRMLRIGDEIWRKLLVRMRELRDAEDARARAVDTPAVEPREPGWTGEGPESERPAD